MLALTLFSLLWSGSFQADSALCSFETVDEVTQLSTLHAQMETVEQHATDGGHALKVRFLPAEWPHWMLTPKQPWDWSKAGGVAMDVFNPGSETVTIGIRVDDDAGADGWQHSRTANVPIQPGATRTVIATFGPDPMSIGMRGLPPGALGQSYSANGGGTFEADHVVSLQVFLHNPAKPTTLYFDRLRTVPPVSVREIVDRFGQFTRAAWPGKIRAESDFIAARRKEEAELKRVPALAERNRFGGWLAGPQLKGTGFFRTEKWNGKWWLVDPEGRLFFSAGVDTMRFQEKTFVTGRESMFTWLPKPGDPLGQFLGQESNVHSGPVKSGTTFSFYGANLFRKYGANWEAKWKETTLRRLPSWGFNTVGNWSDESLIRNGKVPYVATASIGGTHARVKSGADYWSPMHDPFDPQFATDVAEAVSKLAAKVKGDPYCLGYFVDNELSWAGDGPDGRYGLAWGALAAPVGSPAKKAFVDRLKAKYGTITALNRAWGTTWTEWTDLDDSFTIPGPINEARKFDASGFVRAFARKYFQVIRSELRKVDSDHLYLGCRFAWRGPEAEEAAGEVCDVVSYNIYTAGLGKEWDAVNRLNKPCIIGEFHFGALDRGMFHPGLVAAPNQATRAAMFEKYVTDVLKHPAFAGCHWFQYVDEPLVGRSLDGENFGIGFVSVTDTPYPELVSAARRVLAPAYRTRSGIRVDSPKKETSKKRRPLRGKGHR